MNKGLEAWERIKKGIDTNVWQCGYWDDIELIEKELKAFEIIKNNDIIAMLDFIQRIAQNKEQYDFLIEVLQ